MIATLLAVLATVTSTVTDRELIELVIAGRGEIPGLEAVQRAAAEALELGEDGEESSVRRARWRGAVPRIEVRVGTDRDLDVRDSFTGERSRVATEGQAFGVDVSGRWEIGDLVFSDLELRIRRESLARAAAIRLARDRVTRLYFERLEVLLLERRAPSPELALRAARLDGLIRAHTGGLLDRHHRMEGPKR